MTTPWTNGSYIDLSGRPTGGTSAPPPPPYTPTPFSLSVCMQNNKSQARGNLYVGGGLRGRVFRPFGGRGRKCQAHVIGDSEVVGCSRGPAGPRALRATASKPSPFRLQVVRQARAMDWTSPPAEASRTRGLAACLGSSASTGSAAQQGASAAPRTAAEDPLGCPEDIRPADDVVTILDVPPHFLVTESRTVALCALLAAASWRATAQPEWGTQQHCQAGAALASFALLWQLRKRAPGFYAHWRPWILTFIRCARACCV